MNFASLISWAQERHDLLAVIGGISIVMLIGSIAILTWLVTIIPTDYFAHQSRVAPEWKQFHPIIRLLILILKNLAGWMLLLVGISMLVLPGQGLLSILLALMLMDYPGKYKLERWVITRPGVLHLINRFRRRWNRPDLTLNR